MDSSARTFTDQGLTGATAQEFSPFDLSQFPLAPHGSAPELSTLLMEQRIGRWWRPLGTEREEGRVACDITICTFNILAEGLEPQNCALSFCQRKEALLEEILCCQADVICLQEVDHFADFFQPALSKDYVGCFVPKTKWTKKEGQKTMAATEGQAIFVRKERLQVIMPLCWTSLNLREKRWASLAKAWKQHIQSSQKMRFSYGTEKALQVVPQIVLGVLLQPSDACHQPFLVTSMHLKCRVSEEQLQGMDYDHFKHLQCQHFLRATMKAAEELLPPGAPVLCGADLNLCLATDQGAATVVEQEGFVDAGAAYPASHHTVDYILVRAKSGSPEAVWELPSLEMDESAHQSLPNAQYPSDHILRAVQLSLPPVQAPLPERDERG